MAVVFRIERASRKMLFLRDKYRQAFPDEQPPLDPKRIAQWAYEQGMWKPIDVKPAEVLRRKLCRAFRHEYITDPQGRDVRASFASVEEVMTPDGPKRMSKFYPIFETPPEIVRQDMQMERRQTVQTAYQLTLDLSSYNENNQFGAKLPDLDWNIGKDIDEMNMPTDYDPDLYGDDEEDDD
jgi:hypothetical protein